MGKTARELLTQEIRTYRLLQTLEAFRRDPSVAARRDRAWKVARTAADLLRMEYGATRVVVFGSLAWKTLFTPWSDIDLAAWGIKPEAYYSAAGAAMDMGLEEGIKIDLVDAENCSKEFYGSIDKSGVDV